MNGRKPRYADLSQRSEDERIDLIGDVVMRQGKTVGFIVDAEPADKADRYIAKLQAKFPGIVVDYRGSGPAPNTILVKVMKPKEEPSHESSASEQT